MATVRDQAASPKGGHPHRRHNARIVAGFVLGALLAVFAALNSQTVRVHWIVTTTDAPLIVVIAVCAVIGILIGWLFARRRQRQQQGARPA